MRATDPLEGFQSLIAGGELLQEPFGFGLQGDLLRAAVRCQDAAAG